MPEIAEVETVKRVLQKKVLRKKIKNIEIYYNNIIENNIEEFNKIMFGNEFTNIDRIGKYLIFELQEHYLISHLRMEGKYFYFTDNTGINLHDHVKIIFSDNSNLIYNDTRKFGKMRIIKKSEKNLYFSKLGPEPNDLTVNYLLEKFKKSKKNIKTLLLDQSIIAGLGNIYANEVLFEASINPYIKGNEIDEKQVKKIITVSQEIVKKAIEEGGCTIKSYTSSLGVTGNYQNFLKVHMREGCNCFKCKTYIKKEKIDGRSTYYCEHCQK